MATRLTDSINTSAEIAEAAALPCGGAVHCDPDTPPSAELQPLPPALSRQPVEEKSEAQWAYERLILYIRNFESQLDARHEIALVQPANRSRIQYAPQGFVPQHEAWLAWRRPAVLPLHDLGVGPTDPDSDGFHEYRAVADVRFRDILQTCASRSLGFDGNRLHPATP